MNASCFKFLKFEYVMEANELKGVPQSDILRKNKLLE